ncbi:hypothetical protein CLAFUW4_05850 [Fulvia fulva]|nr:hypothetical protein CLAFUR4_05844 [Fulvia fulva]WPV14795.1 hypothetical protein CLAFUW4_05850 [Fulvia fulva]WPV30445.1 hypothetical protein CLAFUW7_05848 [Fulvia fulva]
MALNAPKPTRSAEFEPCRYNKQSCDHERPVCSRCIRRGLQNECVYRERPFKKRKLVQTQTPAPAGSTGSASAVPRDEANGILVSDTPRYPNPGFQGTSNHVAIFQQLPCHVDQEQTPIPTVTTSTGGAARSLAHCYCNRNQGEQIMEDCLVKLDLYRVSAPISFWLATDTNLGALGGHFVPGCVKTVEDNLLVPHQDVVAFASALASKTTANSKRPLTFDGTSTFQLMKSEHCGEHILAGGRAAADIRFFPPLYKDDTERDELQKLLSRLAERCLESAVSLGRVNNFLLISQYENFILYTVLFGDQSFDAWRRLGDVISSLLFLGHNEDNKRGPACPLFLAEVRRNCFAQIYLADKELLLFLGRPPRLSRVFCCFQVPRILQVLFLLHKGNLQQPEPAASIHHSKALIVAKEMLSLVVECISFREGLVDSGCSLNWTIVQYGLPAAGFVALPLIRNNHDHLGAKFIQDLCVFVSEVQAGGVITVTEPNYALLSRATTSLQSLLTQVLAPPPVNHTETVRPPGHSAYQDVSGAGIDLLSDLPFLDEQPPLDFWTNEEEFWGVLGAQAMAFQWDGAEMYGAGMGH